ncbi:ExeM/NucH family extracellular endonuclease [Herbiconiux daphne]|uniref:ExeM/NucH family extracellular endonuclease n=1 Tax=Herbiconiux daphne TaxID=2970914 RepID=A0ABT2H4B9_9MICO|nr:ExeM/NucH family extracellular endonuclease [Herbiconiux daphne]MCS5734763.1 ExeM/NucH family extracellular endonuclease [Herbiconiux daphne]
MKAVLATVVGGALFAAPLIGVASSASASVDGTGVVINEAYLKGGSAGAPFNKKFVELYNPSDAAVALDGWSLQYRSATVVTPANVAPLSGTIAPDSYFLVQINGNGANGSALPTPDLDLGGAITPSGTTGTLILADTTTALAPAAGSVTGAEGVVDLLGYGASNTFEGTVVPVDGANSVPNSLVRTGFADTDVNAADFTTATTVTPQNSSGDEPAEPGDPVEATIADIQGATDTSPLAGQTVITTGVVTAAYGTGGFDGYYIQTPGTGGAVDLATHTVSDGLFVYSASTAGLVEPGDYVEVTGAVSEFNGLTELAVAEATDLTQLDASTVEAPTPATVGLPADAAQRESLEGMLVAPQGDFTVSDTYSTNQYAEIGLASGTTPLITPTEIARPGTPEYTAAVADNAARAVTLDDGSSTNFLPQGGGAAQDIALPYLKAAAANAPITVGAAVDFTAPVIFDYRNDTWKFQPTGQLTADGTAPATFSNVRAAAPAPVGGDIQIAGFNVLNYFTTTGDDLTGCSFYVDRDDDPVTVNTGCDARGAAEDEDLARQQAKIVAAINGLGAEVVSLEEIENSVKFGEARDEALSTLTAALNAALPAGEGEWDFVPSPAADQLPPVAQQDVIRTAFIYKADAVEPVGASRVLLDAAFANARQPLAQEFVPVGGSDDESFIAIVNHFKSKGSGSGADADQGDGQGASNASRVAQAQALLTFSTSLQTELGTSDVFLIGDFNAYSQEDPAVTITDAGYVDQGAKSGKYSYSFDGASGSLDHVFASPSANAKVTGVDIWNINSGESIALEYSRYNYNATNFYDESVYRSSDHDPVVVGYSFAPAASTVDLNLIDINDFHGRIDANTVKFAGTIEQLRAAGGEANTLFVSSGDNVGASLFESDFAQDQPTIDVLNELELDASAVGNHEFDKGFSDLTDRIIGPDAAPNALWDYLGANVYAKGTTTPVLPEYATYEKAGLTVAVIGAVTQETPTLVSPAGVADLDFGDPVDAVNRVAAELTDGDESNGEADVIVATYHEGAPDSESATIDLETELAKSTVFAKIVNDTAAAVDVIFTGHTHQSYVWDGAIPGEAGKTRPVLQTGSYGANVGHVVLTVDAETGDLESYTAENVARLAAPAGSTPAETAANSAALDAQLVATYPRVAEVKATVDAAIAAAAVVGNQPVGSVTKDITTAYTGGSYVNGVYTGGTRDDRASESTLGNLVADSLVDTLSAADRGGAEIGVVNPGGLRAELLFAAGDTTANPANTAGVVTYSEANAVLPFVNNLWTTSLTGAQFKTVLEQQWQTDASGNVPSRPFLKLGLSDNVTYTYDPAAAQGQHITGIFVDGAPIDPAASYRIGTFSFLTAGGDNFRELANGTDARDSGLIDRDAWIAYLRANPGLTPDFARGATQVTGVPESAMAGTSITFTVGGLDLTSQGAPQNTALAATWTGSAATFDSIPVSNGSATVTVTVPLDAPIGDGELVLTASPSGTEVHVPVTVTEPIDVDRIDGASRYDVAVNTSKQGWPEGADTVYVVSGEVFPDALSAAPAAAADDAPILLTTGDRLPPAVQTELERLAPSSIVIVGGENSVKPAVETALKAIADDVTRIAGADRFAVSRNVAAAAFPDTADVAVLATGTTFADALSAGAAVGGAGPVILVDGAEPSLDDATMELLEGLAPDEIAIAGGRLSVSSGIFESAQSIASTVRLGGTDRYAASRAINKHFFDEADRVLIATGVTFPDALSGSAFGPKVDAPLFTVPGTCIPAETLAQIQDLGADRATLLGGVNSLSEAVENLTTCPAG